MLVAKNAVVAIEYHLTDAGGKVIDSSRGKPPLTFIHGTGSLITGVEKAIEGKAAGDKLQVTVSPEDGYGVRDEKLIQKVPRDAFKSVKLVEVGMQFQAQSGGQQRTVTVVGFERDMVKVDANHPLAGQTLNFDITVVSVREATKEEIEHGHVHGPGGHHHH